MTDNVPSIGTSDWSFNGQPLVNQTLYRFRRDSTHSFLGEIQCMKPTWNTTGFLDDGDH